MKPIIWLSAAAILVCLEACVDEREKDAGEPFYGMATSERTADCFGLLDPERAQCEEQANLSYDEAEKRHQAAADDVSARN